MKRGLLLLLMFICLCSYAKVLKQTDFTQGKDWQKDWDPHFLGDGSSYFDQFERVGDSQNTPLIIRNKTDRGWGFVTYTFSPDELRGVEKVYISCDIMTNMPEFANVALADGDEWGGICRHWEMESPLKAYQWQRINLEIKRNSTENIMSAAFGLSYNPGYGWIAIDNVVVTADEPTDIDRPMPNYSINVPKNNELTLALRNDIRRIELMGFYDKSLDVDSDIDKLEEAIVRLRDDSTQTIANNFLADAVEIPVKYTQTPITVAAYSNTTNFDFGTYVIDNSDVEVMNLPGNAKDSILYLIRNNSEVPQDIVMNINGEVADKAKMFRLKTVAKTPNYPELIKNGEHIHIGREETCGVLVEFDTEGVPAGIYSGSLDLLTFSADHKPIKREFKLNVGEFTLGETMPIKTHHWDYNAALDPQKLEFMMDSRVNCFQISLQDEMDNLKYELIPQVVAAIRERAPELDFYIMVELWYPARDRVWPDKYNEYLTKISQMLEEAGVPKNRWYLQIYDEELPPIYLEVCKIIEELDPEIQIFSDCLAPNEEVLESFLPYLDIWCPHSTHMTTFAPQNNPQFDRIREFKEDGVELWVYRCDPNPSTPPLSVRHLGALAAADDLDGLGFWTLYTLGVREPNNRDYHWGFFYNTNDGLIRSRHWMNWCTGLEDFLLFDAAKKQGGEAAEIAQEGLAELQTYMANGDDRFANVMNKWRGELLKVVK